MQKVSNRCTNCTFLEILSADQDPKDPKPVNQVKDFYKDCIDVGKFSIDSFRTSDTWLTSCPFPNTQDTLETVGVKPIRDALQQPQHGDWPVLIGSRWNLESFHWLTTISDLRRVFLDTAIISVYVDQDLKDSDNYSIYVRKERQRNHCLWMGSYLQTNKRTKSYYSRRNFDIKLKLILIGA